jgi:CRP/FNR family transcriptional regulator, nitrogen oxide reductase regulator
MPMSLTSERPRALAVLQSNTLLNALTYEQIEGLAKVCRPVYAERGEMIWWSGADVDFFGLAADGFVKMVRSCPNGNDVTMELFGPGQIFGMMGTITRTGCPLSSYSVTNLWYLRIPKKAFLDIYEQNIPLKDRLLRKTALRLHAAVNLMAHMSSGRVEERIAAILFILSESYGHKDPLGGIRLDVPLTRQEISDMAGTTVESTIRVMSRWQKEGIVSTERQHVVIQNTERLARILAM